jgi:hypothetical protein
MSNQNVKLKKEHTHEGVKYKVDSVLKRLPGRCRLAGR